MSQQKRHLHCAPTSAHKLHNLCTSLRFITLWSCFHHVIKISATFLAPADLWSRGEYLQHRIARKSLPFERLNHASFLATFHIRVIVRETHEKTEAVRNTDTSAWRFLCIVRSKGVKLYHSVEICLRNAAVTSQAHIPVYNAISLPTCHTMLSSSQDTPWLFTTDD